MVKKMLNKVNMFLFQVGQKMKTRMTMTQLTRMNCLLPGNHHLLHQRKNRLQIQRIMQTGKERQRRNAHPERKRTTVMIQQMLKNTCL